MNVEDKWRILSGAVWDVNVKTPLASLLPCRLNADLRNLTKSQLGDAVWTGITLGVVSDSSTHSGGRKKRKNEIQQKELHDGYEFRDGNTGSTTQ